MSFQNDLIDSIKIGHELDVQKLARQLVPLISLPALNPDVDTEQIQALCKTAITPVGSVATICVYPQFVETTQNFLQDTPIQIATVANFPYGDMPLDFVIEKIEKAIEYGANEIELVWPYSHFLAGFGNKAQEFVQNCSLTCAHQVPLKVILALNEFPDLESASEAARLIIQAGADFIKTGTGLKHSSLRLCVISKLLSIIKEEDHTVGLDLTEEISCLTQVTEFLDLAEKMMGPAWISHETLRFSSVELLTLITQHLDS